jgi:hypothetical protein
MGEDLDLLRCQIGRIGRGNLRPALVMAGQNHMAYAEHARDVTSSGFV